jgi:hypothetical protein
MQEEIIETEENKKAVDPHEARKKADVRAARKIIRMLSPGNVFRKENVVESLPFIFFLTFLAVLYIANSYYSEKTIKKIDRVSDELKELHSEYISTKSELMHYSRQSEVAKAIEPLGLKESLVPPLKLSADSLQ